MDRGGPETAGVGGPLRVSSETRSRVSGASPSRSRSSTSCSGSPEFFVEHDTCSADLLGLVLMLWRPITWRGSVTSGRTNITESAFLEQLSQSSSPEVVTFAQWVLEQAPAHDLTITWGEGGPLLRYEDAETGHRFTFGKLSRGGTLGDTYWLGGQCLRRGIDASIYQNYLDQVAALIPGATRRRFRTPKGTEREHVAISDGPKKGSPPLAALVTHATAEVEYLANKWYRDQVSISQLSFRYRHRISGSRTYGYIGVSPWHYRTRKRWTGRTAESELAFVEQSGQNTRRIELSVGRAVFRRFSIRVGGHLGGGYTPNLVLAGAYSFF